jgi:pimeloyl-ACP methyl ester carboxylesterase
MSMPVTPPALVFGEGPPVVLLHAFPLDGRIWLSHATALSTGYQVLVPDVRGFGKAYGQLAGLTELSIDGAADDLAQLLDERGIPQAVIGGISRGGYVALAFARKYPERTRALMLFDTRANPADEKERQTYADLAKRLADEGISAAVDVMKSRLFAPGTIAANPDLIDQANVIIASQQPDAVAAGAMGMVNRLDARPDLARIEVPVLAMAGVHDAAFENTRAIAEAIPGATFIAVPDAGHLCTLEQPDFVIAAMRRFLDSLSE